MIYKPENENKLYRRILKRFQKALTSYNLIEDGDKILVGLSGGKDSLCLLELLANRMRIARPSFRVEAVHIRMENIEYESNTDYLQTFSASHNVPLHIETTRFEISENTKKPACFLCSWYRRKQIFKKAQELGCNKIALGHHMDDIIHTALMNIFFQGQFSTMPVKLEMKKMPITIIRPLCLETEDDIRRYAEQKNYEKLLKSCPFETASHRTSVRNIFEKAEQLNPEIRYSIWNALETGNKLIE